MFRDSFPAPPLHKDAAMNAATALFQCIYLNDLNSTLEELELCFMVPTIKRVFSNQFG